MASGSPNSPKAALLFLWASMACASASSGLVLMQLRHTPSSLEIGLEKVLHKMHWAMLAKPPWYHGTA